MRPEEHQGCPVASFEGLCPSAKQPDVEIERTSRRSATLVNLEARNHAHGMMSDLYPSVLAKQGRCWIEGSEGSRRGPPELRGGRPRWAP